VVPDGDVQRAVEAELSCHPNVDDTDIVVNVQDGVVTLSGYARNLLQKYGAEDAVKRVAGVRAVANKIELERGVRRALTDPEIAHDVVSALKRVLPLCWERIRPLVRRGTVTLEGTVNAPYQREVAEDTVRRLRQVLAVINAVTLAHGVEVVESADIKRRIEQCLRRSASLDPGTIAVHVNGAQVTLQGRVRAWAEHREAEECAWSAPGVRQVQNELLVNAATQPPTGLRVYPNGST
jgi:osmotically-inducible protein OsmY